MSNKHVGASSARPQTNKNVIYERDRREKLVSEILKDFQKRREERRAVEVQWQLNLNFMNGNQYAEITPQGSIEDFGKYYYWQKREVFNHIAPIVETRIAKLGRVKSGVSVRAFSNDADDVGAARLSTQILKAASEETNLSGLISEATYWSEVTGSAFYKTAWNDGVQIAVCSPYEIFPDSLTAGSFDNMRSLMHVKAFPVSEIKEKWGVETAGSEDGYAEVIEYYERPTSAHKNGRLIVVAGNKLAYEGELPYVNRAEGERGFPFSRQTALISVDNFFGRSLIERMIPVQRAYNAVKNRKHEFINRLAMGVLAVEDGSVDTAELEDEGLSPGKILVYRQGSNPPVMMNLGSVPAELTIEEERLLNEFIVLSGVSEFAKYGHVPSGVSSGIALSLMTEQDDTKISIAAESIRHAVMSVSKQILHLYKQFAEDGKIAPDDLIFDTENELADTPASRKDMVFRLVSMGLLHDENGKMSNETRAKVLEAAGFAGWGAEELKNEK